MATKFLELKDGIIVEIGAPDALREEMHTSMAEQVDTTMKRVASMVGDIVRPLGILSAICTTRCTLRSLSTRLK